MSSDFSSMDPFINRESVNFQKGREAEIERMNRLQTKGAGQHSLSPDEKSELNRLRSKYRDVVKKRDDKNRKSMPKG